MYEFEVEQKYRAADTSAVRARLTDLGIVWRPDAIERDLYFAHPARDFALTDEALRIRMTGDECRFTYKGPKIDAYTKTRREIELALVPDPANESQPAALLEALGFRRVREVVKTRSLGLLTWQGHDVEVACDDVLGLGRFVELEIKAEEANLTIARAALADLAARIGLDETERRSYLELLINSEQNSV